MNYYMNYSCSISLLNNDSQYLKILMNLMYFILLFYTLNYRNSYKFIDILNLIESISQLCNKIVEFNSIVYFNRQFSVFSARFVHQFLMQINSD
jgi:hypothetical protein